MFAQLEEDLVHLEGRGQGLDQAGRADRAARQAERPLRVQEDLVPQARLEVALQLGEIEVGPGATTQQLGRVVEEEEAEVDEGAGHVATGDAQVPLRQVEPARTHNQRGRALAEAVGTPRR